MKHRKLIEAYQVLNGISHTSMDVKTCWKLMKLKKKLQPYWDFQYEEEKRMIDELQPEMDNGNFIFKNEKDGEIFNNRINEISEMETEWNEPVLQIQDDCLIMMSMEEMEKLDGLIDFV